MGTVRHVARTPVWFRLIVAVAAVVALAVGFGARSGVAQSSSESVVNRPPVRVDSSGPSLRRPDAAALDRFRADPAFDYDRARDVGGDSWWDRVERWLWETLIVPLIGSEGGMTTVRILLYLLIAAVVAWAVYVLLQLSPQRAVKQRDRADGLSADVLDAAARGVDFDAQIDGAVADARYRDAVRLLYLHTLHRLDAADVIEVRPEKTNHDYLDALRDTPYHDAFATVTRAFEYVWYGDLPLDRDRFATIRDAFDRMHDAIGPRVAG